MASYPLPLSISVLQSNWSSVEPTTSHLLRFSSLLSSHCKPYEAQNAPHVVGTMPSKSITAVQAPRSPQILLFFTSVQPVGSQGVELGVGDGVVGGVGNGGSVGAGIRSVWLAARPNALPVATCTLFTHTVYDPFKRPGLTSPSPQLSVISNTAVP